MVKKKEDLSAELRVTEIYPAILGESLWAGLPGLIIRLTGCNLRCSYCDTTYAYTGGRRRSVTSLLATAERSKLSRLLVTGGEPLLQPATASLLTELTHCGFQTMLETNGSLPLPHLPETVHIVMDLKTPASGEAKNIFWPNLRRLKPTDEIKIVLVNREDYLWAKKVLREHELASRCSVTLSPAHGQLPPHQLARWLLQDRLPVRLGLQLHKYIFGDKAKRV